MAKTKGSGLFPGRKGAGKGFSGPFLDKKGVGWASPKTLMVILLCVMLGLLVLYLLYSKVGAVFGG